MRAITVRNATATLENVTRPVVESECLIRVTCAGICGTDLELLGGYAAFAGIPGHEFVGVVEEAPAADRAWIGRRVVGEINVGCGSCEWCRSGVKEHCERRTVVGIRGRDGAFAEYLTLPAANLHEVPAAIDDEQAVFVEPVAAACRILEQIDVAGSDVAVLGDGRLGLLVGQVLRHAGARVRLHGRHARKMQIAERLGLEVAIHEAGSTGLHDIVVDATGRAEGLVRALHLVKPRGTVVLKSTFHGTAPVETWPVVVNEVRVIGSRCGPFAPALELVASGAAQVQPLVSGRFALDDFESAFNLARRELKVLFRLPESRR